DAAFVLKNGVALYGGFAGNENLRKERDWDANPTTFSGEIQDDGVFSNLHPLPPGEDAPRRGAYRLSSFCCSCRSCS
ncbi:MAG: hypothetical protein PHP80_07490, partial [Synergistaceae bacterium]|nr:hypothetical protein [Synergistaceae bacterium]